MNKTGQAVGWKVKKYLLLSPKVKLFSDWVVTRDNAISKHGV